MGWPEDRFSNVRRHDVLFMVPLELKDILTQFVKRREVPGTISTRPYKLLEYKLEIS